LKNPVSVINLVVDSGNSRIKAALFKDDSIVQSFSFQGMEDIQTLLTQSHDNIIVSSVKEDAEKILNHSVASKKKVKLTTGTALPIHIRYSTPNTLGVDRIAAACGAFQLFPGQDCLVIDVGTCINYEMLDRDGNYWGGIISPGVNMRFEAMHTFTARLPLVQSVMTPKLIGDSTLTCMQSGVMNGIMEEMNGIINRLKSKYPHLRVILSGGDSRFFENQLKPSIFAAPEIVLVGLNRILMHNVTF
jgi:type III pantothenate kinase